VAGGSHHPAQVPLCIGQTPSDLTTCASSSWSHPPSIATPCPESPTMLDPHPLPAPETPTLSTPAVLAVRTRHLPPSCSLHNTFSRSSHPVQRPGAGGGATSSEIARWLLRCASSAALRRDGSTGLIAAICAQGCRHALQCVSYEQRRGSAWAPGRDLPWPVTLVMIVHDDVDQPLPIL
jgi:hypothetical protein